MENIKNLKFITEENEEYIVLFDTVIDNEQFGYAVNLKDESDAMCIRLVLDDEGYFFDIIEDEKLKKQIIDLQRAQ